MQKNKFSQMINLLAVVFTFCMLYLTPAQAKEVDIWLDQNYDFKNVKAFAIKPVDFEVNKHVQTDDLAERKINDFDKSIVTKAGYKLIKEGEVLPSDALTITPIVELWYSSEKWHDPYTSWESRVAYRTYRDHNGHEYTEPVYYDVPVYHPGYYSYWSHVQVRYEGRDAQDNLVYIHKELRSREDVNAHYKMYERITKDFFTKFESNVKKQIKAAKEAAEKAAEEKKIHEKSRFAKYFEKKDEASTEKGNSALEQAEKK